MAKNMPVPNTRILNVPKTTGTQKFIISSKRCFSSFNYGSNFRVKLHTYC